MPNPNPLAFMAAAAAAAVLGLVAMPADAQSRGRGHAPAQRTVNCESINNRYERCQVGPWRDAELVRQESRSACVRNRSWGLQGNAIWVSDGCRGVFAEVARGVSRSDRRHAEVPGRGGWQAPPAWNRDIRLGCSSDDNRYRFCTVDVGPRGSVRLINQESRSRCVEGQSWGWNRAGVWVDRGCRAQFLVERRG